MNQNKLIKVIYIIIGSLSLALGMIGIFLPVLPTTPFLLLTAYFYLRSSERLYHWLLHHKVFGKYIHDYIKYRSIPLKTKILALVLLWPSIVVTLFFIPLLPVKVMLVLIASTVSVYIIRLKTRVEVEDVEESICVNE
jgi:hypothetical protein